MAVPVLIPVLIYAAAVGLIYYMRSRDDLHDDRETRDEEKKDGS